MTESRRYAIRGGRLHAAEYEQVRVDLAGALRPRLIEADQMYDLAESILTNGPIQISKTRGLGSGVLTVVLLLLTKALKTFRAIRACALDPDFRFGRGTLAHPIRGHALISAGSDRRNPAKMGDTLWVTKNPSRSSSLSMGF